MKRGAPLTRKTPLRARARISQPHAGPGEGTCAHCAQPFLRLRPLQAVCSPICARRKVEADKKAERESDRQRREALKRRRDWIAEAQAAVNKYVRLRDLCAGRGCISCGARPEQKRGGTYDAGHFRSVGSAPHLRFYLPNVHLQCVRCNRHLGGNAIEYRRGLVERIGSERVEAIEAMQGVGKWSVDYLRRLKAVMAKRARRLEKRLENEK